MAQFDELINDIGSRFNLSGKAGQLIEELLRMITTQPGGISGFLDKFRTMGLGSIITSWLGTTSGEALSGQQVEQVLGSTAVNGIANRVGLTNSIVGAALGYALPKVIGLLTPGGTIPSSIPVSVTNFLGSGATYRGTTEAVPPRRAEIVAKRSEIPRWALPAAAALAIIGFLGYMLAKREYVATPSTPAMTENAPVVAPAPQIPSRLALDNENGSIHYSGTVANEATQTSVVDSLKAVFGANNIVGSLNVNANAGPATWLPNLKVALENFKTPGAQAVFEGNAVKVSGMVPEADRARIIAAMQSVFGAGMVSDTVTQTAALLPGLKAGFSAEDLVAILNRSTINFATGSAEIPADSKPLLQQAANAIKQLPAGTVVQISGLTDAIGDPNANLTLSLHRADSVRQALIDGGVLPAMLTAKGLGSAMASNRMSAGVEGRSESSAHDRRIMFSIVK